MNVEHLVSILTLTYNHQENIGDCIRSVQAQTYENWEMLIVDDGSTDDTFVVASEFAKKDKRIKVFTQENIGVFRMKESYNFALERSKGKYIAILDGDDVWMPEKLAMQIPLLEENEDAVVCFGQAYRSSSELNVDYSLDPVKSNRFLYRDESASVEIDNISKYIILGNIVPALTILIRRNNLEMIGGFIQSNNLPLVDLPTLLELSLIGSFIFLRQPLGKWRHHGNEVTLIHAIKLGRGVYEFSLDFYKKHSDNPKLFKINENLIYKKHHQYYSIRYSRAGRYKLSQKDYIGAKHDYIQSICKFGWRHPLWKIRSIIGLFFTVFHLDLEKFVRKIGRASYK